jgi:PAS domain S-box-containing protein
VTPQNQKTILLVEDEALINVIEKQTLIKHGFNVIVASNGEKAISAVRNTLGIDLILMDINLGKGIDGTEAAEIILKERDIPLLFLSSYTQPEVVERTEKITSYGYVVKDSGETVLLASIKMAFKLYDAHKHLKESEEALKEREKTLQAFFDAVHESMVLINTEGTVLLSNAVGAQRLGKTAQEFIGTSLYKHFPPDVARYRKEHYDKVIATGEPVYFQDIRSGRSFEQHCYPLFNEERKVSGVTIFAHEVTDRKKTEDERQKLQERLHHADKMESIGTLAGGIAHDFNNLLMGIRGYASLMLQDIDSSHPYYKKLTGIEEQVQSGADLTSQLLGFARGGRYEVKPADMNNIIEKTSSMFGRTKKEIVIHGKYGKDLWTVEVDQGQMEQVLLNLYVNAGQAMPGGGELYLETENVLLDDTQTFPYAVTPGRYIKISLTDTGTGIDEKTKERIFDPFFTTKEVGKGTGLGLAMAYGIIKGHGGMINVYSEPNHGTTFTLYLPASDKAAYKETPIVTEILSGSETILLVDDEPTVLEVSKEILEFLGYTVYAMKNGREAIVLYKEMKNDIALIILDMIMPGLSGGETFDRIRELNPLAKIILSSGYSLNSQAKQIMDKGCQGFIQKPFNIAYLSQKIREVLEK